MKSSYKTSASYSSYLAWRRTCNISRRLKLKLRPSVPSGTAPEFVFAMLESQDSVSSLNMESLTCQIKGMFVTSLIA